ncbi:MAG: hypothetical protein U0R50_08700 [Gaiellales bacterium]
MNLPELPAGQHDAEERAWVVVRQAFVEREPVPRRRGRALSLAVPGLTLTLAVVAAAFSPTGRAVVDRVRNVVGVRQSAPALFSLPTHGRLLVSSTPGVWVIEEDGSKRLLRGYDEASWSPLGRYLAASNANELAALEPNGRLRWSLARPSVRSPRWAGTATDTRIAYRAADGLHVVAGDGTGDRLIASRASGGVAWRPGTGFTLAYLSGTHLRIENTVTGKATTIDVGALPGGAQRLAWSPDGQHLVSWGRRAAVLVDPSSHTRRQLSMPAGGRVVDAGFSPNGHRVAVLQTGSLLLFDPARPARPARILYAGPGPLTQLTWSPDGKWILAAAPAADQWVFVHADDGKLRAVSNIAAQLRATRGEEPVIGGWCCAEP